MSTRKARQISTFKVEQKSTDAFSYVAYYDFDAGQWVTDDFFEKMSHFVLGANAEYTSPGEARWFGLEYGPDIGIHPATIAKSAGVDTTWKGYDLINGLTGSYKRSVALNERFSLALDANLALELHNQRAEVDYTGTPPDPYDTVEFSVNPDIAIGAEYAFARKPFTLYSALNSAPLRKRASNCRFTA